MMYSSKVSKTLTFDARQFDWANFSLQAYTLEMRPFSKFLRILQKERGQWKSIPGRFLGTSMLGNLLPAKFWFLTSVINDERITIDVSLVQPDLFRYLIDYERDFHQHGYRLPLSKEIDGRGQKLPHSYRISSNEAVAAFEDCSLLDHFRSESRLLVVDLR